jgi:hypothetical protein
VRPVEEQPADSSLDRCTNCFAELPAPRPRFCGACGQETRIKPPTVGEFIQQLGGAYFSTEGALWRTLALLLFRPGELTRRYLAGRRKHYVLPLRLYITISLATLLLVRLVTPLHFEIGPEALRDVAGTGSEGGQVVVIDFGNGSRAGLDKGKFYCERLPAWLCNPLAARMDIDRKSFERELKLWPERFLARWGTAMFLLVPIFALFLKLAYLGRGLRYTEHLVHALHLHSFWFLAVALSTAPVPGANLAFAAMPVYTLISARRVYGGGWLGTVMRALAVALLYGIALGIALGVVGLWAFMFG